MKKNLILVVLCLWLTALSAQSQCDKTNDIAQTSSYNYFVMSPDTPVTVMALQGDAELPLHNRSNLYKYYRL